jgi:hypothetical protein
MAFGFGDGPALDAVHEVKIRKLSRDVAKVEPSDASTALSAPRHRASVHWLFM